MEQHTWGAEEGQEHEEEQKIYTEAVELHGCDMYA